MSVTLKQAAKAVPFQNVAQAVRLWADKSTVDLAVREAVEPAVNRVTAEAVYIVLDS